MRYPDPDRAAGGALSTRRILTFVTVHIVAVFAIAIAAAIGGAQTPVLPVLASDYTRTHVAAAARPDPLPHRPARLADFAGEVPAWVRERAALDAPGRWSESVSGRIVLHDR